MKGIDLSKPMSEWVTLAGLDDYTIKAIKQMIYLDRSTRSLSIKLKDLMDKEHAT